jgi:hypothetical protein
MAFDHDLQTPPTPADPIQLGNKYGASATHMEKLLPRIEGGGGGGCPILAFGITSAKYVEDNAPIAEQASENGDEDSE